MNHYPSSRSNDPCSVPDLHQLPISRNMSNSPTGNQSKPPQKLSEMLLKRVYTLFMNRRACGTRPVTATLN